MLRTVPHTALARTTHVVHAGFDSGLNDLFLIGAILAAAAAVLSFALIRNKDFAAGAAHDRGDAAPSKDTEPATALQSAPASERLGERQVSTPDPSLTDSELDGVETVLQTTERALTDLRVRIDQLVEEHRDAELAAADAEARELRARALTASERYAEGLHARLEDLTSLSERCRAELREQSSAERHAAAGAATARAELYRLIGEIGALADGALDAGRAPTSPQDERLAL